MASFGSAFGASPTYRDGYGNDTAEEPLLQELGINFQHMRDKTLAVLNVTRTIDSHLMDDTDLAGPLVFCLLFSSFLLMVRGPNICAFF